jgi:ABC-2 type transport system ATP-binding protein
MIEIDHVSKRFGKVIAVDDLSFTVRPGHVTGFLGPNGAGKSTTMRVVLGLDEPTAGAALVNERSYRGIAHPLHEVGSLLDADAVHGGRTAWLHLLSVAQGNGIGRSRAAEVLRLSGLDEVKHKRIGGFSLGMKQRLGIATALLGDPPVLIFDEPVNGLDPEGVQWIRELFKVFAAEGRTVLVSSHLMSEMALTADRLIIIGRGKLLADTTVDELTQASRSDVLVESPRAEALSFLLSAKGATVVTASGAPGTLIVTGMEAGAVVALPAVLYLPLIVFIMPAPWKDDIGRFTLVGAVYQLVSAHPSDQLFSPGLSLIVMLAWPAVILALAAAVITRHDA